MVLASELALLLSLKVILDPKNRANEFLLKDFVVLVGSDFEACSSIRNGDSLRSNLIRWFCFSHHVVYMRPECENQKLINWPSRGKEQ